MSLADVQVRSLAVQTLRRTATSIERELPIPFERTTNGLFIVVDQGRGFKDPNSGQTAYTVVYVAVGEDKQEIGAITRSLTGPAGDQE